MELLAFSFEMKSQVVAPKDGYVLLARFKHPNMEGFDTIFCDYAFLQNGILQLFNCRSKRLELDPHTAICQEYGSRLGNISLASDYVVQLYQAPCPLWLNQAEEDLPPLMNNEQHHNPCHPLMAGLLKAIFGKPGV